MKLIAHRGLHSKNTKENTLLALLLGNRNNKIDGIELDVRLSKDHQVVVIHDTTIDRTSNGSGKVSEMSLDRLKRFNFGSFFKRSTINTLNEVLSKLSSNGLIIIELKDELDKNNILVRKVLEIIKNYPYLNIWLKSFSVDIVNHLKEQSNRPIGLLIGKSDIKNLSIDADFYSVSKHIITKGIIRDKLSQNKPVMVWTVNSSEEFNLLQKEIGNLINNIYIISDNPLKYR